MSLITESDACRNETVVKIAKRMMKAAGKVTPLELANASLICIQAACLTKSVAVEESKLESD